MQYPASLLSEEWDRRIMGEDLRRRLLAHLALDGSELGQRGRVKILGGNGGLISEQLLGTGGHPLGIMATTSPGP